MTEEKESAVFVQQQQQQQGWQFWLWPIVAICLSLALILLAIAIFMRPVAPVAKTPEVVPVVVNLTVPEEQVETFSSSDEAVVDGYHYRYSTTTADGDRKAAGYKVIGPAIVKLDSYSLNPNTTRMALLILNGEYFVLPESAVIWELEGRDEAVIKGESPYHDGFFRPQQ